MTEQEAKTKWCPFARVIQCGEAGDHNDRDSYNRIDWCSPRKEDEPLTESVPDVPELWLQPPTLCIGSACMAWRWDWEQDTNEGNLLMVRSKTLGHCGLAGNP